MYLHGYYKNKLNQTITVYILTGADRTQDVEIGARGGDVFFGDDAVELESQVNDTFDVMLRQQAKITLLVRSYMPELFQTTARNAIVNIYRDTECLFAGFIEPQTYSQGYNEELDELELNCIDALTALQYSNYGGVGAHGVRYAVAKNSARNHTFYEIIDGMLTALMQSVDILGTHATRYFYDGSKAIDGTEGKRYSVFDELLISELLFLGDEEDDVWKQSDVMQEILKYLNLHIVQHGFDFYIFDWQTVKTGSASFHDIRSDADTETIAPTEIAIRTAIAADADTEISIGDTYNRLELKCDVKTMDNVIESPLDDDALISPYSYKQLYMKEYSSDGEGEHAYNAFEAMMHDRDTSYVNAVVTDWYMQVMTNRNWNFTTDGNDSIAHYCADTPQQTLPNAMRRAMGAAIISWGSVERKMDKKDNSPTSKVAMTNYLVISVNGNGEDAENQCSPNEATIKAHIPMATYESNVSGGVYSPPDDATNNYIVISGNVVLNPIMRLTDTYANLHGTPAWQRRWWHQTVPSRSNGDGRYYTQQYFKATTPHDAATWDAATSYGLVPFTDKGPQEYEFRYSAIGESADTISKVAVLQCMLIIGDKCVVETGTQGQVGDFTWQHYKERSECASDDEYYAQSFSIGFDPKIGDKLVGTKFSLQNNIDYTMGVDAEGIAIRIRKEDRISGAVRFMILGPVNLTWDEITRRHGSFWRHTRWGVSSVPLMAHVSSIMLEKFEIKLYSDNGKVDTGEDGDLIYMSDTNESFYNRKDDLEMKINSALTSEECYELGVKDGARLSAPLNAAEGVGCVAIYDRTTDTMAKPEQQYVDAYYREYGVPRVEMQFSVIDEGGMVNPWAHYTSRSMGKAFFVEGIDRNLTEGTATLKLKEINN